MRSNARSPETAEDSRFNAVAIAESLDRCARTGKILHDYLEAAIAERELPVIALYNECRGAEAFRRFVLELTNHVHNHGLLPLLHIEAHGSLEDGIYFADGTVLTWTELCDVIRPLNVATAYQLTVFVAACFGISVVMGVSLKQPAPCFAMVGPSDELDPGEVLAGYRSMYKAMLTTPDGGRLVAAMSSAKPSRGEFILMSAQHWFELLMTKYLEEHANARGRKEAAMRQYRSLCASGIRADLGELKRRFKSQLPQVVRTYFESYFGYGIVPRNEARFEKFWPAYAAKIAKALSS